MTSVVMAGDVAHCFKGSTTGHRLDASCPCRPSTPLTSKGSGADLYVHRFLDWAQMGTLGPPRK